MVILLALVPVDSTHQSMIACRYAVARDSSGVCLGQPISHDLERLPDFRVPKSGHAAGASPLVSADRATLITEKTQILQRRAEHFRGVLNHPPTISDVVIVPLHQVETNADLDLASSLYETIKAAQQLSSGKAPGLDATPAEIYKHGGPQLMDHLTALFQEMWCQGEVPQNFKSPTGTPVRLPPSLGNHRHDIRRPPLQEKFQEIRVHFYSVSADLTKAFDTINREGLRKRMQKFGCLGRFTQMVRQLQDDMTALVADNGVVSEAFAVTSGAKEGCVLSPTLYTLMFSALLMDT
nr:unnamed protein product [Spirometra erinaceieuropaei]